MYVSNSGEMVSRMWDQSTQRAKNTENITPAETSCRGTQTKPVICEIPSNLCEAATISFIHHLGLINSLHYVEKIFVRMFHVKIEPKGVQQNPFRLKDFFALLL